MSEQPLLSICIPTYNRANYLKQCLENIVIQFNNSALESLVEVVVSDNASSDNTREVAESYCAKFKNVKYFRNENNIGMDANIINSVVKATGKYCWNIGDDDCLQNGCLTTITDALKTREVSLFTVDFYPFSDINKAVEKKHFDNTMVEYVDSAEDFYNKGYCQGILGIFIFNKEQWLKVYKTSQEKYWGYYEAVMKIAGTSGLPMAYLKNPAIYNGQDYRWNKDGTAFFITIHNKRMMEKMINFGYSKNFVEKEVALIAKKLPRTLVSAKSFGLKCTPENFILMRKEFKNYPYPLFLSSLIFFLPNSIIKFAKNIKKNV